MPSRKDYPEYYEVIVEPIDLVTIKNNIESKTYPNLKAIQDDLLLMIKNAHHFNEPGSSIYKMATTLRRCIINRCIELERKYKTVPRKSPPPPGEGLKNKKSPPPPGIHLPKSKKNSTEDSDHESGDELTATESEEEGGSASTSNRQRLLLKVKRDKLYRDQHPLEHVLKLRSCPRLKKLLTAVYRKLINAESEDKRIISEMFIRRPSPKLYPEYYIVIPKPIDFREISRKIREEQYKTFDEMMEDVELLVDNACTFNEENSQIHTDALMLRKIARTAHDQLKKRWGAPVSIATDGPDDKQLSITNSIKVLYLCLINATDMTGRSLWHTVRDVPQPPAEGSSGDVHSSVKKCMGMSTISLKVEKGEYTSLEDLFNDVCALLHSYCEHNLPGSQPYKDAVMLHRISVTKYNDLSRERRALHKYPNAQEEVKKLLSEIVKQTLQYKDENGRVLSDSIKNVVVTQELPTKDDSGVKTRRVFSLAKVMVWASNGRYTRLDQLQTDVLQVLHKVRQEESDDKNVVEVSRALEKAFINIRDKICDNGKILWSPALKRAVRDVVLEEELEKEEKAKNMLEMTKNMVEPMDTSEQQQQPQQQLLEPIVPIDQRQYRDSLTVNGVVYEPGEFVYLPSRESHLPAQISLIECLWTDKDGNEWFDGCWFPRPHETYHVASRKFYEKEIFKSDFYCSHRLSRVVGKCCVLFIKDFVKYEPKGFDVNDVFVCESRYMLKAKTMKKIKSWNIFYKYQPILVPRKTRCSLNRVPSVFVATADESVTSSKSDRGSVEPVPEQESVSEQIQAHDDSFNQSKENASLNEDEDSETLEMSFFDDLKEVPATVNNPEENCTYFEQFCIDDVIFKLGDHVCVQSDHYHPYIARIDKMWTDNNNDPWFHGPWFVRVTEAQHLPTRMFYERELFMSNIHDTNPMRSIIRKCSVLGPTEFVKLRPTEVLEDDVFVCESKYNEADKSIRKHKGLKVFQLSEAVLPNEIYYLPEPLHLWKNHSPNLITYVPPTPAPTLPVVKTTQQQQQQTLATPTTATTTTTPTTQAPVSAQPVLTVPLGTSQLTLTLPQIQALISTHLSANKNAASPITPPQVPAMTPPTATPVSSGSNTILAYPCTWGSCREVFEDNMDLGNHIIKSNHIVCESDGYYCYWKGCPRTKEQNGKPFDALQKITRHVKEVHMLRIVAQKVTVDQLGANYHRRGTFIKEGETTPTTQNTQQSSGVTPQPPAIALGQPIVQPDVSTTPTPITLGSMPITLAQLQETGSQTSKAESAPPTNQQKPDTPPNVFIPPPKNNRQVIHSQIYIDYIKRLRSNAPTISPLEPLRTPPSYPVDASQWIDTDCIPDNISAVQALSRLRDVMMSDVIKISQFLDKIQ